MKSTERGRLAEDAVTKKLAIAGFKILARNWRTKACEIDLVAAKDEVVYFVEVKYRKTDSAGSGLDYITSRKLAQMEFAARIWTEENKWTGDYRLAAIEVEGDPLIAGDLIEV